MGQPVCLVQFLRPCGKHCSLLRIRYCSKQKSAMSRNPYQTNVVPPPTSPYKLTVKNTGQEIVVDPDALPDDEHDGLEGSILAILLANGVEIGHSCGGVTGCSTCHIYVNRGLDSSPEASEDEEDQLDFAPAVRDSSRLSCQCVPDGSEDVEVEIPAWNRNEVLEDH